MQHPVRPPAATNGNASLRTLAGVVVAFLLPSLLLLADPPSWWASRGASNSNGKNDYAAVNQGQLKKMATAAFLELSANLPGGVGDMTAPSGTFPGGTGYRLTALINNWSSVVSGTRVETTGSNTNDYSAVNLGQLKTVAKPFYDRLIEVGYANQYPWESSTNAANDYAAANIGQVKKLFSFNVTYDSDSNGLPDWWELYYFGVIGQSGTTAAPSGNGLTILQSYQDGVSPIDFYNGISPTLTIISGTNQTGAPGALLSSPLVVQVTGTSGASMVNAPVTFGVTVGSGVLAPDNSGTSATSSSLQVTTGTDGKAQVWFQQPFDASFTSTVAAYAEDSEVDFSATTSADTNPPATPSDVLATVQGDGSVQVTWTDNSDNETGFTIQMSSDGGSTWTTIETVAPDSTSYSIDPSQNVTGGTPIQIIAGTSATTGTAYTPLPITNYATIDVSGDNTNITFTTTNTGTDMWDEHLGYQQTAPAPTTGTKTMDVMSMALGDDNRVAYCFLSGSYAGIADNHYIIGNEYPPFGGPGQITVNTWNSGTTTHLSPIACDLPGQLYYALVQGIFPGARDEFFDLTSPGVLLDPQGDAYGMVRETFWFAGNGGDPRTYPSTLLENIFYQAGNAGGKQVMEFTDPLFTTGTANLLQDPEYYFNIDWHGATLLAQSKTGFSGSGGFRMPDPAGVLELPPVYDYPNTFAASFICYTGTSSSGITVTGTTIFYDPAVGYNSTLSYFLPPETNAIATPFLPIAMNDGGKALGTGSDGAYFWSGTNLVLLGTNSVGKALNNQNMVVGTADSGTTGKLWLMNSGSSVLMQSLVPAVDGTSEVTNIVPYAISNADSSNRVSILCSGSAMQATGTAAPTMQPATLLFNVDATIPSGTATSGTALPPKLSIAKIPVGVTFQNWNKPINSSGIISGIGTITSGTITSSEKALMLLPVEYKQSYASSGFDAVSQPHWLMVPSGGGSNQAIALTPATSSFTVKFLEPSGTSSASGTVPLVISPATTGTSSQAITVSSSGSNAGDNNQVVIGTGTVTGSGGGLGIDVKPMLTETVAIHAVTQHYTNPMVLLPGMVGTPGTVCVSGNHTLSTTPVTPDDYGPDGSLTIITGADGICHTTAVAGDTQSIPVGQAIPADIAPADVPTAANLQTYLDQVFGTQANIYFTVIRNDFTVDYDTKKDGILDVVLRQGLQSAGQKIIDAKASSGVTFNVFYVKDYQGIPLSGTIPDHSSDGVSYFRIKLAYVRDIFDILQTTAHEIGHLLDLGHTNAPLRPSGALNPASINNILDVSPENRLMAPSGTGTLLIKPEWDIINPNSPLTP